MPEELDRRALVRLGLVGGALVAVPTLIGRATSAGARSPFDPPFGVEPAPTSPGRANRPPLERQAKIVSRAEWHADEGIRSRDIDFDTPVEKIIVHHTGTKNTATDWAREVRSIYKGSVARGYRDVPYHWLIDPNGVVYEGRWARRVAPGRSPNGEDARGRSVRGGHAKYHNERTIAVALLGNFDGHRPSLAAFDALVALLAWKCNRWALDPLGSGMYHPAKGDDHVLPNICPHGHVRATICPGRAVVDLLPTLRMATVQRLTTS